uniref:Helix-turn-helix domain-containing protein n=1 Tax=Pseudomonas phage Touem01 TaxID=3138548 RepID=A0AAU6W289_9VIRU
MTQDAGKRYLSPTELVDRWDQRVSTRTLANWRSQSSGPRYIKIGGRVAYRIEDITKWEDARTVGGTCEYQAVN